MKETKVNRQLSLLVLLALVGGLLLAACGGTAATPAGTTTEPTVAGPVATTSDVGAPTEMAPAVEVTTTPAGEAETPGATVTGAMETAEPGMTTTVEPGMTTTAETTTTAEATGTVEGDTGSAGAGETGTLAPLLAGSGADQEGADPNATLTLNLESDPVTLDPQVESFSNEIDLSSKVFAPLLTLTPENEVAQNAAESYSVSNGGKTYTFTIREHNYSDGQPVTAESYANAIKRACSPEVNGNYSSILYDIVGCEEWRTAVIEPEEGSDEPAATPEQLQQLEATVDQNIRATDERTLQINLEQAAGYFPYVMTTWVTYPTRVDLAGEGNANWWKQPQNYIGNGPFKLTAYTPKQQMQFQRNDDYFRGRPGIANLNYRIVGSSQQAFLAYRQGQFDALGISADQLPQVNQDAELKAQLKRELRPSTFYVGFNSGEAPFDNLQVRQAFAAAIDRERYIRQINNGVGQPAGTFLYEGIPGYQTEYQQTFDPQRAKQLLAEAGYENGRGFPAQELPYDNTDEAAQKRAVFFAQQFSQNLGVQVRAVPRDPVVLQEQYENRDPALHIYLLGWLEDYPHPQDWLSLVFANNSPLAPAGWNDQRFNQLTRRADALPIEEAAPIYAEADAYLAEQTPAAFYLHAETLSLIKPNVKGYVGYVGQPLGLVYQPEKIYKTR